MRLAIIQPHTTSSLEHKVLSGTSGTFVYALLHLKQPRKVSEGQNCTDQFSVTSSQLRGWVTSRGEGQGGGMFCSCQANVANAFTFNHRLNPHINDTLFTRL